MTSRAAPPRFDVPCAFDGVHDDAGPTATEQAPRTWTAGVVALDEAPRRGLASVMRRATVEADSGLSIPPRVLRRVARGASAGQARVADEFGMPLHADLVTRAVRRGAPATRRPPPGRSG